MKMEVEAKKVASEWFSNPNNSQEENLDIIMQSLSEIPDQKQIKDFLQCLLKIVEDLNIQATDKINRVGSYKDFCELINHLQGK